MDDSRYYLIATPTPACQAFLTTRAQAAPIVVNTLPIFFLAPPGDRDSLQLDFNEGTSFRFEIIGHGFVFNPANDRTEFSLFIKPEIDTLLSDMGVDVVNFRPYGSLAIHPMRTSKIRYWLKNFGDSLVGQFLELDVTINDSSLLPEIYNPTLEQDHPGAYSYAL
jgi:hypothetical protein